MTKGPIDWSFLLHAYRMGYFPMAEDAIDDEYNWIAPERRCILPINEFHCPKSLQKLVKRSPWLVYFDQCTEYVIEQCAQINSKRPKTWINEPIKQAFIYGAGIKMVHSVSVHDPITNECYGGLYGLAQGGVFNGESMFSTRPNASKIALVYLMGQLKKQGFVICDAQFSNPHLDQFYPEYLSFDEYQAIIKDALTLPCTFL